MNIDIPIRATSNKQQPTNINYWCNRQQTLYYYYIWLEWKKMNTERKKAYVDIPKMKLKLFYH